MKPYALLAPHVHGGLLPGHEKSHAEFKGQEDGDDARRLGIPGRRRLRGERGRHPLVFHPPEDIKRLTTDHIATSVPVKLGLMLERQAMASPSRSELTRSIGTEPFCQPDFATQLLHHGDFILQCTDGLHACVLDEEMREIIAAPIPTTPARSSWHWRRSAAATTTSPSS
jgi:hypothetical protein